LAFAFVLVVHNGQALKIAVLVFMVTVFFVVSMLDVVASIPREQYDLATTLRFMPWRRLWEVVVLGQADQVFVVLRQTAAMSWMTVATAEAMSRSGGGVGVLLANSNKQLNLAGLMALQLIVLALGLGQDWLIERGRREFCRYAYLGKGTSK
jgi:NitT/TauT family transport system permease protein